ncbi:MAG: BtaA family protein [Pirellulaceae bacterium]|nr:BtaA family protein [Pirellulaceae bacterium]
MAAFDWLSGKVFKMVHGNNLVYNTCWEDPRLDREALEISSKDDVLVITSAGCNALDYSLLRPNSVQAVDMNPRQNALLELKIAAAKKLNYDDFFQIFGNGYHPQAESIYKDTLRSEISNWSQGYWDKLLKKFFANSKRSFYFRGTSGGFAKMINFYIDRVIKARPIVNRLLDCQDLEEQRQIYHNELHDKFWTKSLRFFLNRDTTLSLLGVPKAQRRQVEKDYKGGIVQFMHDCLEAVFAKLPMTDNYFWRVYLTGRYTQKCCPEYLKETNFEQLKTDAVNRLHIHTNSVEDFLKLYRGTISRYVLLDHMDWLSDKYFPLLESEWQAIMEKAAPETKVIWRSGGLNTDFISRVNITKNGQKQSLDSLLTYHPQLSNQLHEKDRVHTYGSFYITDLAA